MVGSTVRLRRVRETDGDDVLAAFVSDAQMHRQGDLTTREEAHRYMQRLTHPDGPHLSWAVTTDDRLIGVVVVTVEEDNRNGWFWYWMHAEHRGRGWMQRAAATVADWALATDQVHRLELEHQAGNPASGTVARSAGFILEGTEREKLFVDGAWVDVLNYGRLLSDPPSSMMPLPMV